MQYTQQREDALFASWTLDTSDDLYNEVIETLNSSFRSFGEGLVSKMEEKEGCNISDPIAYLKKKCNEVNIDLIEIGSLNTLKSWFNGGPRPKKSANSRRSIFAIAFALGLTVKETSELFHKVYLDRAFDYRVTFDVICYYCLSNKKNWQHAKQLESRISDTGGDEQTVYTNVLRCNLDVINDDTVLLQFLERHGHNLSQKSVTAKKRLDSLLLKASEVAGDDVRRSGKEEAFRGSDWTSKSFVYEVITELSPSGERGTVSVFKNAALPKEIKSRFPEAASFSKSDPTYEEIRKMIILIYSYIFWFNIETEKTSVELDDYIAEMNATLAECGYPELYVGNPHDWLYMYCTLNERPLDTFRGILAEVVDAG